MRSAALNGNLLTPSSEGCEHISRPQTCSFEKPLQVSAIKFWEQRRIVAKVAAQLCINEPVSVKVFTSCLQSAGALRALILIKG